MPSLDDVFAELQAINGRLDVLHNDSVALHAVDTAIKNAVDSNVAATNSVKAAVDGATAVLKQIKTGQDVGNAILLHLTRQADTMICSLEQIARHTCAILTESDRQTRLQIRIAAAEEALVDMTSTVHPEAALELARHAALKAATDRCCPPPPDRPACEFKPCEKPKPLDIRVETPQDKPPR
ncbi:hypothetical protein [Amaricoccus sp.]|uniref:hypothetical protein n=1 Tax=Amaricoccus sp. TaxID=1872485 RepID=UPI00261081BF|nr:hypothetical protein [Amaricoccus sp.]HRO11789.1 hypothetical protein [Amaricoccus sp.]